jgi:hypothetical protein
MKLETWDLPNTITINSFEFQTLEEKLKEYQQARQMPALQHFIFALERKDETCAHMMTDAKKFILCIRMRNVCT